MLRFAEALVVIKMAEAALDKLNHDVEKFLVVYKLLTPEAKALFEGQLLATIQQADERSQKLYYALLEAARKELTKEEAIAKMQEVSLQ